jgi:hypothetical protein
MLRRMLLILHSSDPKHVSDVLTWWHKCKDVYPVLSRMAREYLSIPGKQCFILATMLQQHVLNTSIATFVNIKQVFSKGQILLSHLHSHLSVQSMHFLMCVGAWSLFGYVKDWDIRAANTLPEVDGEEEDLQKGWDVIGFEKYTQVPGLPVQITTNDCQESAGSRYNKLVFWGHT